MDDSSLIRVEAEHLRSSGVLGEARLRRLFDYLVDSTLAGHAPKEISIAIDVFGKGADFDVSQDALVRVYVHKLRRALADYYRACAGEGRPALQIPKGEYRLRVISAKAAAEIEPVAPEASGRTDRRVWMAYGVAAAGVLALIVGAILAWGAPRSEVEQVRANPIWSSLLKDDRPIMIVVGDYYLIGETDSMGVKRLIREYTVNSKGDLDHFVAEHPEVADRYIDVGLRYLPVSSAFALRDVMAVLAPQNRRITISKMSDVEPSSLKADDIIYIGYLSGMGMLQDLVFTPESRFTVGESYDEVIDKKTKHSYASEVGSQVMDPPQPSGKEQAYHDYGVFAKFRGPGGNVVLVISGTRDEGVSQTAETFTSNQRLQEFAHQADVSHPIEALLEVSAFDGVNLSGKLLLESNRDIAAMPATADARAMPPVSSAATQPR
ncbi:MAG TPA: hypothetical protein VNZ06_05225 [Steroidobacteraceae bacterium]|jgi:hypothetical protein|nr:hypothetical protein [Steroidobacteraceae bacterium]